MRTGKLVYGPGEGRCQETYSPGRQACETEPLSLAAAVTPGIHQVLDALHEKDKFPFTCFPLLLLPTLIPEDPVQLST